jgi:hypothetical protein
MGRLEPMAEAKMEERGKTCWQRYGLQPPTPRVATKETERGSLQSIFCERKKSLTAARPGFDKLLGPHL